MSKHTFSLVLLTSELTAFWFVPEKEPHLFGFLIAAVIIISPIYYFIYSKAARGNPTPFWAMSISLSILISALLPARVVGMTIPLIGVIYWMLYIFYPNFGQKVVKFERKFNRRFT
jgi:hypothetical protein